VLSGRHLAGRAELASLMEMMTHSWGGPANSACGALMVGAVTS
jgi:hypothetical protein